MRNVENTITPQEKEELFLRFFPSYLTLLSDICSIVSYEEGGERHLLEDSLINSLTLMWQIHVAASTLKMYYRKVDFEHGTSLIFNQKQSKLVIPKCQKLKLLIEAYPNIEKSNKQYCLSLLEQIKLYYERSQYVIVNPNSNADPWLASFIKKK